MRSVCRAIYVDFFRANNLTICDLLLKKLHNLTDANLLMGVSINNTEYVVQEIIWLVKNWLKCIKLNKKVGK